ncbi:carboxymuconolactone decarboxylase family protein [Saccharothrix australiensis]|uniref:AhpD family alkylhydroperoxidase n=1 Tax=Saccharothrix australiensis TaxID=2072 RepID=A0A495VV97_9PSEU|nr:carboxymuconolactone decarboxylase family protein [Saccharothrix australiensis]RKT53316.1 AhpD family alkylhydroperoxidase [Saccharothrix australiensis]
MRMNLAKVAPEVYQPLLQLESYAQQHVDPALAHLIKVRASILNGCAYCVDIHTAESIKAGEHVQRLFALSVWRESKFFTDTERVVLEFTDAVTRLGEHGVPDEVWEKVAATFEEQQVAGLLAQIISINAFNRIGVTMDSATQSRLR